MSRKGAEAAVAPHWLDDPRNIALVMVLQGAVGLAIGLAIWWGTGRAPGDFVGFGANDLLVGALAAAALIGAMQALILAFPRFLAWAAERQKFLFMHGRRYRPAHILLISLGAGVGEEALFRGGLQTFLGDHMAASAAILLASLLFAALHWPSRVLFPFILAFGAAFGIVYHETGSLAGAMLAHAAFDIWAIAIVQRELVRQGFLKA